MGYGASAVGVPPPSAPPPATHPLQSSFFPRAVPTALARPAIPSPLPRGLHGGSGSKNPAAERPSGRGWRRTSWRGRRSSATAGPNGSPCGGSEGR